MDRGIGGPFLVTAFGAGWALGSDKPWYWGVGFILAAAAWQAYRSKHGHDRIRDVVVEQEKQ